MKIAPAVLLPFPLQIPRCNSNLFRGCRNRGFKNDPVCIAGNIVIHSCGAVSYWSHSWLGWKSVTVTGLPAAQLTRCLVPDARKSAVVDEGSIVPDRGLIFQDFMWL